MVKAETIKGICEQTNDSIAPASQEDTLTANMRAIETILLAFLKFKICDAHY